MVTIETYRGTIYYQMNRPEVTVTERTEILLNAAKHSLTSLEQNFDSVLSQWARRFADYVMVGRIVSVFPTEYKYRGLEGIEYWPLFLLPNPLRPAMQYDPRDSATLSERVKIGIWRGSSPAMIIGDLYSRFSWPGVFFGMALVGCVLRWLDNRLRRFGLFETLLYGILLVPVVILPHETLLGFFLFLTRTMLLALLMAAILNKFVGRNRRNGSFRHPEVLRKMPGG
jgi:hypothetical protein